MTCWDNMKSYIIHLSVDRAEKEKQVLILEIDSLSTQLDSSNKAAQHNAAKAEALDEQVNPFLRSVAHDLTVTVISECTSKILV